MNRGLFGYLMISIAMIVLLVGCNLANSTMTQPLQTATTVMAETTEVLTASTQTEPAPTTIIETAIAIPESTDTPVTPTVAITLTPPTAANGPTCTVLQALNMRTGPGTAYRPPIRSLPAQTILEPLGYEPQGIPGGPWLQAYDRVNNQIGWVSAGSQFISCNIDLTSLPAVSVAPPAPPAPPNTTNSTPDGTFPPNFVWEADFNKEYFVRFRVYDINADGTKDGDGIESVSFQVLDAEGNEVYQRTERQSGFCIFGGGEPTCNPWTLENNTYVWKDGGKPITEGNYKLLIVVSAVSGDQGNWNYDINLRLP